MERGPPDQTNSAMVKHFTAKTKLSSVSYRQENIFCAAMATELLSSEKSTLQRMEPIKYLLQHRLGTL
jgi:hypothetical protein